MEWGAKCSDLETQLELASVQKEEVGNFFKKSKLTFASVLFTNMNLFRLRRWSRDCSRKLEMELRRKR